MNNLLQDTALIFPALLIPLFPLIGFMVNGVFGKYLPKQITGWLASLAILGSFICAAYLFLNMNKGSNINIDMFEWISFAHIQIGFGFLIDPLTLIMLLVITGIGFLIHLYSISYMHEDEGFTRFFTYLNMFVFFMLLLVMGNNYLVMFIGWEGVGLCSYLLIGFWFKNNAYNNAAKKAFIMNRIGDLGFLLGMFFMLFYFGSLNYDVVANEAAKLGINNSLITITTILLFVGASGKSAQIPLYTWLPDAMAGPTPVSALIHAATMVTAGIYMIVRSNVLFALSPITLEVILIVGILTSVMAAIIGLLQNDIKKVLAYSTVSQLGLMFCALGMGAFSSGMFHVVTHAFFKALLFLGSGSVIHALHGEQDIRNMGGLAKYTKVTFYTFFIGSLAISGIFPFAGFFSKDEILAHAFQENIVVWIILTTSSLITAFYMFRLVYLTFFNEFRGTEDVKKHIHESPALMTIPLVVLTILSVIGGFMGLPEGLGFTHAFGNFLSEVTAPSLPYLKQHQHLSHATEIGLMIFAVVAALSMIVWARIKYVKNKELPAADESLTGLNKIISNKFYVDEFYNNIIVKPITVLSDLFLVLIDKLIIDLAVNATAWVVSATGKTLRLLQNGNTGFYVFAMVIGMIVLLLIRVIL
ncbi:MAG: NADH-quinone oxidoreductase subunit L [Bacteroidia bacterium]|jgi:NADH-quinone oxidoreductase subunit L|nr:NADH-quinone oxidoreductase subunit L [Bacteroidia bacterium]